jgi:enolase-phosphatase E1
VSPVPDVAADAIVLDIEGTTTPVAFVYRTLFPYARRHLRAYLEDRADDPSIPRIVEALRREQSADPDASGLTAVDYVEWLMDRDRKSTALKELQGLIWEEGYRRGELRGEVFPDVLPAFEAWHKRGVGLGIFSSGSVLAQKLLFGHSSAGDLTRFLTWYFDTTTGSKTAPDSYGLIASAIGTRAGRILFVSDVVGELDAARAAGMRTALSRRPGNAPVDDERGHPAVEGFLELRAASA